MNNHDELTSDVPSGQMRVSVWLLEPGGVTGAYLGDGALRSSDFVMLYPSAARGVIAAGPPPRVRVAAETGRALYVTDGSVMQPAEGVPESLVAIELDWPIAEQTATLPELADAGGFDAIVQWLEQAEREAPEGEPSAPQRVGFTRKVDPSSGRVKSSARDARPWWCQVWPGCWGC